MLVAHDTEASLQSAVALVNSAEEPDTLTTIEQLDEWYAAWFYSGSHARDEKQLAAIRALRPKLRELLTAERDAAAEMINTVLADARAIPRLVRHDGVDWHLHAEPRSAPLTQQVLVETAMALADLVRLDEMSRLAICADDTCSSIVLDLTRNRSRRFCSTACANRNAVAAYRARKR